ncbi:MAG: hypothetical protein ABII12_10090 [Planctomycetota bacterium]
MTGGKHAATIAVSVVLAAATCGCREQAAPDDAASRVGSSTGQPHREYGTASAAARAQSPANAARLLQKYHQERNYAAMAPLIAQDQRERTIALLEAVDTVLDANTEMQVIAQEKYGGASYGLWDLAAMENNLGPFSARVSLFSQHFKGDEAFVTLQEGDNVPLVHGRFAFDGDAWRYHPDPAPASIVPELHRLAETLRGVSASIRKGASFESYDSTFVDRVLPQIKRVATARDDPPDAVAAGETVD